MDDDLDVSVARVTAASCVERILADELVSSVFQPIIALDSGAVVAYEALARGPVGPLQSPLGPRKSAFE